MTAQTSRHEHEPSDESFDTSRDHQHEHHLHLHLHRRRELKVRSVGVDGAKVRYTGGGHGPSIVFLHGWGLGHHAYRRGLRRLATAGYRVAAPALPGFGATPDLPMDDRTFPGFAAWAARFIDALDLGTVVIVGHSFGGGVATQLAADRPDLVSGLIVMNAVGGRWREKRGVAQDMAQRPWWDWSRRIPSDVVALLGHAGSTMPSVLEDLVPNVVRNPLGVAKVGHLARNADLRAQHEAIRARRLPVAAVHSDDDGVIPRSSFETVRASLGVEGRIVKGNHSWPLTEPGLFASIVDDFVRTELGTSPNAGPHAEPNAEVG